MIGGNRDTPSLGITRVNCNHCDFTDWAIYYYYIYTLKTFVNGGGEGLMGGLCCVWKEHGYRLIVC